MFSLYTDWGLSEVSEGRMLWFLIGFGASVILCRSLSDKNEQWATALLFLFTVIFVLQKLANP